MRCWECVKVDKTTPNMNIQLCWECFLQRQNMVPAGFEQFPEGVAQLANLGLEWVVVEAERRGRYDFARVGFAR